MAKFQEGDTVRLKSGGPPMTVDAIITSKKGGSTVVRCKWFEADGVKEDVFSENALEKVDVKNI